jgi:hypothetical protein
VCHNLLLHWTTRYLIEDRATKDMWMRDVFRGCRVFGETPFLRALADRFGKSRPRSTPTRVTLASASPAGRPSPATGEPETICGTSSETPPPPAPDTVFDPAPFDPDSHPTRWMADALLELVATQERALVCTMMGVQGLANVIGAYAPALGYLESKFTEHGILPARQLATEQDSVYRGLDHVTVLQWIETWYGGVILLPSDASHSAGWAIRRERPIPPFSYSPRLPVHTTLAP